MNNSVLKSPVLWGFLILVLMFVSLSNSHLVWAGPDSSHARQTVPTMHYIFLPLIQKNYLASPGMANTPGKKSGNQLHIATREMNRKSQGASK